jgi:predicted enzyme involved in methoxymalonyl-ACP biosynthesis
VLGRKVEQSMLGNLVEIARNRGVLSIKATYVPTAKNMMVSDHFDQLGFSRVDVAQSGIVKYELKLIDYRPIDLPFGQRK